MCSITPRTNSVTEFKRVTKELLDFAKDIDPTVMIMPWRDDAVYGPITSADLMNPHSYNFEITNYVDKPAYSVIQAGVPLYRLGVWFSVNIQPRTFLKQWNLKRQSY